MPSRLTRYASHLVLPLVAGGLFFLTGCPGETPQAKKPATAPPTAHHDGDDDDHDHEHGHHHHHADKGPHGGALVAIGQDDAHLEFVLDAASGKLTAYVLDGEAEKSLPIKQANLQLAFSIRSSEEGKAEKEELPESSELIVLAAVEPADDGTATEFSGESEKLKGVEKFEGAVTAVHVAGKEPFKGVNFKYPEGNEEDHHH